MLAFIGCHCPVMLMLLKASKKLMGIIIFISK